MQTFLVHCSCSTGSAVLPWLSSVGCPTQLHVLLLALEMHSSYMNTMRFSHMNTKHSTPKPGAAVHGALPAQAARAAGTSDGLARL